ncbi:YopX family protein [Streptococcus equi]|uniref:Hypothetical phage protein n=1 Tax=Streptococcus equi subsp. equi (strain 4047) TaxID=553482 RepID=C0MAU1_STRE4|nr:YopX family protein [Streptococcus equi]QBX24144.1 hypothetical protein Javan178_0019 [Streptococcus phage Javan178]CAW92137.1 hypothetical phage protein [Streptococcus equi subsp. equi 4047]CRR32507.1 phage protein [Streptococcus equi subsp. equi]CRS36455.1 phage protein [Streptococcus equi subsp. equi]CRS37939.1 phage protein [Streptococcus equi subsp. equi]
MIPKFRVWDEDNHKMSYSDYYNVVVLSDKVYLRETLRKHQKEGKESLVESNVKDEYIMPLAYSDGKTTIYDKDIIRDWSTGELGVVVYDNEDCAWKVKTDTTEEWLYNWLGCDVIGNTYEDPELLERVEE